MCVETGRLTPKRDVQLFCLFTTGNFVNWPDLNTAQNRSAWLQWESAYYYYNIYFGKCLTIRRVRKIKYSIQMVHWFISWEVKRRTVNIQHPHFPQSHTDKPTETNSTRFSVLPKDTLTRGEEISKPGLELPTHGSVDGLLCLLSWTMDQINQL